MTLPLGDGLGIAGAILGIAGLVLAAVLYRRQLTVSARHTVDREAAGDLLGPLQVLGEDIGGHLVNDTPALDDSLERWKTAVDPIRPRLNPDLVSRVGSLEYFLERSAAGAVPMDRNWSITWIIALVNARVAAENYAAARPIEPSIFPSKEELEGLIIKGQQLGTGVEEIYAMANRRMFSTGSPRRDKRFVILLAVSCAVLGADALFVVLSLTGQLK